MRLYRRDAFLSLPPGTVYCKGEPWAFGNLQIKGESLLYGGGSGDWVCLDPQGIESRDSGQENDRLEEMLANGVSYPMNTDTMRDGFFDPDDLFLVYESDDLEKLISLLDDALPAPVQKEQEA